MANVLETIFGNGFMSIFGDPAFAGFAIYGFFLGMAFLAPSSPPVKILAFFGATILAIPFLGLAWVLWGFGMGVVIWFAVRRFWG